MTPTITVGRRTVGLDTPPYLIAEIGVNHDGSLERALRLVRECSRVGADAAKFQAYKADTLAHPNSPTYFTQTGAVAPSQHAFFRRYDALGPEDYQRIAAECQAYGLDFLCTPFDVPTVGWLNALVPAWKVASADITNLPLLGAVAATGKPVLLSTGAATLREIEQALAVLALVPVALLHCVLAYPTAAPDANLLMITGLMRRFPERVIGYSDHTVATPEMEVCTMAYLAGARIIEKHYTDDKTRVGNDHAHSMDAADLVMLKSSCDWVGGFFGGLEKGPVPVEAAARRFARRGVYAGRDLPAGVPLQLTDLALLRPTTQIGPDELGRVLGRPLRAPVSKGTPLTWEHLAA